MRSSSKNLALTSVAYAVTLLMISSAAATQLNTLGAANAAPQFAVTKDLSALRAEEQRQANLRITKPTLPTREQYFASKREPLTGKELAELLRLVGFEGKAHKTAWAIVMRESNARPKAHNDNTRTGDNSYGLFQINMLGDLGADRRDKFDLMRNDELFNPLRNAEIAFHMSQGGQDFGSWGIGPNAYRSGAGESTISKWYDEYPGVGK